MNKDVVLCFTSALAKNFADDVPGNRITRLSMLKNERLNFQLAINALFSRFAECRIEISGGLEKFTSARVVDPAKGYYVNRPDSDDYVIFRGAGVTLYPEILRPINGTDICLLPGLWKSVWFTVGGDIAAGSYDFTVNLYDGEGGQLGSRQLEIQVIDCDLEENDTIITDWIHYDCIADYYRLEPFSPEFYEAFGRFLASAVAHGINTVYTPLFTPPLDTQIGKERKTVQLVCVEKDGEKYRFGFEKLKKFIDFCKTYGIRFFEFSHLASQWGATYCPKIVAETDGVQECVFGWHTLSLSSGYQLFLADFLRELTGFLRENRIGQNCFFHISDEPDERHLSVYSALCERIKPYIDGIPVIDALSSYDFYKHKAVEMPAVDIYNVAPFIREKAAHMVYYCCSNHKRHVSNRFFNMPSHRNRILGMQMYLNGAKGFLHWGFNFYNSYLSKTPIDPFMVTDAGGHFQSGDSFVVYPAENAVWDSLRLEVFSDAVEDYRALKTLEKRVGRDFCMRLLQDAGLEGYEIYPKDANWHLELREKINCLIGECAARTPENSFLNREGEKKK